MLAVKTTMKDRWRQILNEANRVEHKHLLTLQDGISETQFKEMVEAKVTLVVPKTIIEKSPDQFSLTCRLWNSSLATCAC